jgi:hypothetical protein
VPQVVKTLVGAWHEGWERFQKYSIGSADHTRTNDPFDFPFLELATDEERKLLPPQDAIEAEIAAKTPRIILIAGSPGTGKSRLLAELARAVSASPGPLGLSEQLVPFLITAQSFIDAMGNSPAERLADAMKRDGVLMSIKGVDAAAVDQLLCAGQYRCIVLIDAVDEIANPIKRKEFVRRLVHDAAALLEGDHLVVVGSRPLDEVSSDRLHRVSVTYRLPFLSENSAKRLAHNVLGELAPTFWSTVTATGLMSYIDTPLLMNLTATLFLRKSGDFPKDILGVYNEFLSYLRSGWKDVPAGATNIVDALGDVALTLLAGDNRTDAFCPWLGESDRALEAVFASVLGGDDRGDEPPLRRSQAILNFAFANSALLFRNGDTVHWAHLLLRDYLVVLRLGTMAARDWGRVKGIVSDRYSNPLWREALVLFVVTQAKSGRAEELLESLCAAEGGFSETLTRFAKDCIHRGAMLGDEFLGEFFKSFEEHAVNDQATFGSCAAVFSDDYGMFWHLLRLQRIPAAQSAIKRAVARARQDSIMSEWPHSDRAKTFTPENMYAGPLATAPPLFCVES